LEATDRQSFDDQLHFIEWLPLIGLPILGFAYGGFYSTTGIVNSYCPQPAQCIGSLCLALLAACGALFLGESGRNPGSKRKLYLGFGAGVIAIILSFWLPRKAVIFLWISIFFAIIAALDVFDFSIKPWRKSVAGILILLPLAFIGIALRRPLVFSDIAFALFLAGILEYGRILADIATHEQDKTAGKNTLAVIYGILFCRKWCRTALVFSTIGLIWLNWKSHFPSNFALIGGLWIGCLYGALSGIEPLNVATARHEILRMHVRILNTVMALALIIYTWFLTPSGLVHKL